MKKILLASAMILAASTTSFSDDYEASILALKKHMLENQIGSSKDYILQVYNSFDQWEEYLLVFGNANDEAACNNIAEVLPLTRIARCIPAN